MPKRSTSKRKRKIKNVVFVSDTHSGCGLALCPPEGVRLDDGGRYLPSKIQKTMWSYWDEFWGQHVPEATHGEPYIVVHVGDAMDGKHHGSTTQISQNATIQRDIAYGIIKPIREASKCVEYYHIRGTSAHVGPSAENEEALADILEAKKNRDGQHARYDLWIEIGDGLANVMHHISTTGSQAYEATAVHKELVESFTEAGRWNDRAPDLIIRGHRHRNIETNIPTRDKRGRRSKARATVLPGWQGKTEFVWKIAGGRLATPHFGGIVARWSNEANQIYLKECIWTVDRSDTEVVYI